MAIHFDDVGYPVEEDRLEELAAVVPTDVPTERYYETDDAAAILVMANGRIDAGPFWLNLLCGHFLFTEERIDAGFGTYPHHVSCPKCRAGVAVEDPYAAEE